MEKKMVKLTFYGAPDNDPPGNQIAYPASGGFPTLHNVASGVGTYENPITVAVVTRQNGGQWNPGTRMYVPLLKKYLIVEDECASCSHEQIDIWMESDLNHKQEVLDCQDACTPDDNIEIEIDPSDDHEVKTTPFFDINSGVCNGI